MCKRAACGPCVQLECINVKAITVEIRAWLRVCYSHVPRSAPTQPCRGGDRVAAYLLTCGWGGPGMGALKGWKRHSDPNSLVRQHRSDIILCYTTSDYLKSDWLLTTDSLFLHVHSSPHTLWHSSDLRLRKWSEHIWPNLSSCSWGISSDSQKHAPKNENILQCATQLAIWQKKSNERS